MKSLKKTVMAMVLLLSVAFANAQINNAKTGIVKIFGNCGMCEAKIEKAGNLANIAIVDWDKDSKLASITYDSAKTNQEEILKRIAFSGYDSEKILAPDEAYNKLPGCCQYERQEKAVVNKEIAEMDNGHGHEDNSATSDAMQDQENQLKVVFDHYFLLKYALVKTDAAMASMKARDLFEAINFVKMESLTMDEHMVWMKVYKNLVADVKNISETEDIKIQRDFFKSVSKNMYELMKVSKTDSPTYYQYCPMVKANWLSKEKEVKNPYYGSKMMNCGKTIETIK
jgi:copper chaperone CopZ